MLLEDMVKKVHPKTSPYLFCINGINGKNQELRALKTENIVQLTQHLYRLKIIENIVAK